MCAILEKEISQQIADLTIININTSRELGASSHVQVRFIKQ